MISQPSKLKKFSKTLSTKEQRLTHWWQQLLPCHVDPPPSCHLERSRGIFAACRLRPRAHLWDLSTRYAWSRWQGGRGAWSRWQGLGRDILVVVSLPQFLQPHAEALHVRNRLVTWDVIHFGMAPALCKLPEHKVLREFCITIQLYYFHKSKFKCYSVAVLQRQAICSTQHGYTVTRLL